LAIGHVINRCLNLNVLEIVGLWLGSCFIPIVIVAKT
jgi:hypothetical protein